MTLADLLAALGDLAPGAAGPRSTRRSPTAP